MNHSVPPFAKASWAFESRIVRRAPRTKDTKTGICGKRKEVPCELNRLRKTHAAERKKCRESHGVKTHGVKTHGVKTHDVNSQATERSGRERGTTGTVSTLKLRNVPIFDSKMIL